MTRDFRQASRRPCSSIDRFAEGTRDVVDFDLRFIVHRKTTPTLTPCYALLPRGHLGSAPHRVDNVGKVGEMWYPERHRDDQPIAEALLHENRLFHSSRASAQRL